MPSKNKDAHVFKVGDPAIVRDVRIKKVVNIGVVTWVNAVRVVFEGPTSVEGSELGHWFYKRKGTRWVQATSDRFELEPER